MSRALTGRIPDTELQRIYVNRNYSLVNTDVNNKIIDLEDVSDVSSITFNRLVEYTVTPNISNVEIIYDGNVIEYKEVIKIDGKFVTVLDFENHRITFRFDQIIEPLNRGYTLKLNHLDNNLQLSYINNTITWNPKIAVWLNKNIAHIVFTGSLYNNSDLDKHGIYDVSLLESYNNYSSNLESDTPRASMMMAKRSTNIYMEDNNEGEPDENEEYNFHVGEINLVAKDTHIFPIKEEDVEIDRLIFIDLRIGSYYSSKSTAQGFGFIVPFYFPSCQMFVYEDSFSAKIGISTMQEGKYFSSRTHKSQKVKYVYDYYTKSGDANLIKNDKDFADYDVVDHIWNINFNNIGNEVRGLITLNKFSDEVLNIQPPIDRRVQDNVSMKWLIEIPQDETTFQLLISVKEEKDKIVLVQQQQIGKQMPQTKKYVK